MTPSTLDHATLAGCGHEPIHIPGAIQPHGVLFVFTEPDLVCVQVSNNVDKVCSLPLDQVLNKPLSEFLAPDQASKIEAALATDNPALESPLPLFLAGKNFDCLLHRHDGMLIAELEVVIPVPFVRHHRQLQQALSEIRSTATLEDLYGLMARFVAELTGYERVMVYRFDTDWHGEVVGECLLEPVESYMGHHFPASDIPPQARELYARNWLRIIPDATYKPAALEPSVNPKTQRPLDLSFSVLRSVSPVHLEYLKNMNVGASMSISLMVEGRLWGLIACHHRQALPLPFSVRSACEIFGQVSSLEIAYKQESLRHAEYAQATRIQTRFFDVIAQEQNFVEALIKYTPELLQFMRASGAAICVNDQIHLLGETPAENQVKDLLEWLNKQPVNPLYVTNALGKEFKPAIAYKDQGSGLLALKLSRVEQHYILWFRPEVITTITWAGDPDKPSEPGAILHPRKSFSTWKQTVTGHSLPWTEAERQGGHELVAALNALVLRRTERLIKINADLEQKNTDLNSFAYIASHDLKEPLRGITHYSRFILEDHQAILPEEAIKKLQTIGSLSQHSSELLDALSHFSKIGRMDLNRKEVSLDDVLDRALSLLQVAMQESRVEIRRPQSLPTMEVDPVLIREALLNLIANSIRYNTSDEKWVEIGLTDDPVDGDGPAFYVKDNGIGIHQKHHHNIFKIFRRLHAHGEYGTGTGAGLAITRSIIERHDGRIWLVSQPGAGTTFYFTLPS